MIEKKDVLDIANLARLNVDESDLEKVAVQLGRILEHAQNISEIDTSKVEPATHAFSLNNVFREDKVNHEISKEDALKNAPDRAADGFKVPKIGQ